MSTRHCLNSMIDISVVDNFANSCRVGAIPLVSRRNEIATFNISKKQS